MKNVIKKVLREQSQADVNQFNDEIFELPLGERKAMLRGLETLSSIKKSENIEEQINYKGVPEMRASSTIGKIDFIDCKNG